MELLGMERLLFPAALCVLHQDFHPAARFGMDLQALLKNTSLFICCVGLGCGLCHLRCLIWDLSSWPTDSPVVARWLSFPARDGTDAPCIAKWILNLWTTREVPTGSFQGSWRSR